MDQGLVTESDIDLIICDKTSCALFELMANPFGFELIEKLFGVCDSNQMTLMVAQLTANRYVFYVICVNPVGAKAMQRLLEKLSTRLQMGLIMFELKHLVVALSNDKNGHYIVNYCVRNFPPEYQLGFFLAMAKNCYEVATNKSGCIVLKSCVEFSTGDAKKLLIQSIVADALDLAQCPFGNYVVQHLIELGIAEVTQLLMTEFEGHFESLSCNKYASNVVEKLISFSGEPFSSAVIIELLKSRDFSSLANDPFANYVVQSALSASKRHLHDALVNRIRSHQRSMETNMYGKKVLAWFPKNSR